MTDLRIGAVFPQTEIGADRGGVRAWAEAVEQLGYRHILAYDHVLGAGTANRPGWRGYTSDDLFHEVFVLFGYLAAVTRETELVTGVLILPQRQTALVAKQAAEVDVLSGGRLRLGVGIGWNQVEYDVLGENFGDRGKRSEEQVELLRKLWAEPLIDFEGRWHEVVDAGINPLPVRRGIPVWFGGTADALLRRTGRLGDGWMPQRGPDETARTSVATIRRAAVEAGRDPEAIGLEPRLTLASTPSEEHRAFVDGWRELGATHLSVNTMGMGFSTVDEHLGALEETLTAIR